jgi:hypothetical protein
MQHRFALTGIKHKPATFTPEGLRSRNEKLRKANLGKIMSKAAVEKMRLTKISKNIQMKLIKKGVLKRHAVKLLYTY